MTGAKVVASSRRWTWGLRAVACLAIGASAPLADEVPVPEHLVWPPEMRHVNRPAPGVFGGIEGESRFETNSFGLRAPEFAGDRSREHRVLFLGGSSVECFYLDQDEAWPALVGAGLPTTSDGRAVWSGNAGRSGHNSRDHIMEMDLLVPFLPVDTVVVMMGVNDLGVRLAQDAYHNPSFLEDPNNVAYQVRHAFTVVPEDPNLPFYRRGMLARILGTAPKREPPKPHQIVDQAGHAFQRWRDLRAAGGRRAELPPMEAAIDEYRRNAERILDRGRELGLDVVFVTQPALWRSGLTAEEEASLWLGGVGDFQAGEEGADYYSAEALAAGLALYNGAVLDVCERRGVDCLDLAGSIERSLRFFYDDCHFNEAGSTEVARAVTAFLAGRKPFAAGGRVATSRGASRPGE